ncbi:MULTISPECIES: hypothetical protein [unclassified Streptomyces]|uniref:hypothetical protein n=1 Tax=unclassified Streptomyces TaxID=2593676 RepID=UPI003D8A14EE
MNSSVAGFAHVSTALTAAPEYAIRSPNSFWDNPAFTRSVRRTSAKYCAAGDDEFFLGCVIAAIPSTRLNADQRATGTSCRTRLSTLGHW